MTVVPSHGDAHELVTKDITPIKKGGKKKCGDPIVNLFMPGETIHRKE